MSDNQHLATHNGNEDGETTLWSFDDKSTPTSIPQSLLPQIVELMQSADNNEGHLLQCTMLIRKMLCVEEDPPIDKVFASGAVPILVQSLKAKSTRIQFEASWALTNLASGTSDHTQRIFASGALPIWMSQIASSTDLEVVEQAAWACGNLSGEGAAERDLCLDMGAADALVDSLTGPRLNEKPQVRQNCSWALSNLCRSNPPPEYSAIEAIIPLAVRLAGDDDPEVAANMLWGLSYLSDVVSYLNELFEEGVLRVAVEGVSSPNTEPHIPALRIIGNYVSDEGDESTQRAIDAGALPALRDLLEADEDKPGTRKEAMWIVSNIMAGSPAQMTHAIQSQLLPPIIHALRESTSIPVKKEAAFALANVADGGTSWHVQALVDNDAIDALVGVLNEEDSAVMNTVGPIVLESISGMLQKAMSEDEETHSKYIELLRDAGCAISLVRIVESGEYSEDIMGPASDLMEAFAA